MHSAAQSAFLDQCYSFCDCVCVMHFLSTNLKMLIALLTATSVENIHNVYFGNANNNVNCTSKKPAAECSCVRGPGMSQSKERNQMTGHQNLVITRTCLIIGHLTTLLRCKC